MTKRIPIILVCLFVLGNGLPVAAEDCTWTATEAGNWENGDNWNCEGESRTPEPGDAVTIGAAPLAGRHVTINSSAHVARLTLNANRRLIIKGSLLVTGDMTWTCCDIDNGGLSNAPNGTLTVEGQLSMIGANGGSINRIDLEAVGGATLDYSGNAKLGVSTNATFTNRQLFLIVNGTGISARGTFINDGAINKIGGDGLFAVDPTFINNGTVSIGAGTLAFQNEGTFAGTLHAAAEATIQFGNRGGGGLGGTAFFSSTATLSGEGTFNLVLGTLELVALTTVPPGTTFRQERGTLKVTEPMQVEGLLEWWGGAITGTSPITVSQEGRFMVTKSIRKDLDGTRILNHGHADFQSDVGYTVAIEFLNNGVLLNQAEGIVLIHNSAVFRGLGRLENTGEITIINGSITISYFWDSFDTEFDNSGTVRGNGAISLVEVPLINTGTFAPERRNGDDVLPGILTVSGDYPNGTLEIDVETTAGPGMGHDQLNAGGAALLGGSLRVDASGLAEPGEFVILTCGSTPPCIEGKFATATIDGPYGMEVQYNPTNVTLIVAGPPSVAVVVNSTGDDSDVDPGDGTCDTGGTIDRDGAPEPECTLRAAIQEANAGGADQIRFDIPGQSAPVIAPGAAFPPVSVPVSIDGTTQPGEGRVRVDGYDAGSVSDGLWLADAHGVVIRGLALYNFRSSGLRISGGGGHVIENTFLGFDGVSTQYNRRDGITVTGGATDVTIGSLAMAQINDVAGGIRIMGEDTRGIRILMNKLEVPVHWFDGRSVSLPIDLGYSGPDCSGPGGPTAGAPNDAIPSPRILHLTGTHVEGVSVPGATVIVYEVVEVGSGHARYWPLAIEPRAHGTADGDGRFAIPLTLAAGTSVTLTATDADGNTSEPSQLRRPVIFAPGIGGTWLRDGDGVNLWLPLALTSDGKNARMVRLSMHPDGTSVEPLVADEVLEGAPWIVRIIYGPIHDHLEEAGFPGHRFNHNPETLDQWRFPHDWRRSAAAIADDLRDLVDHLTTHSRSDEPGTPARSCEVDIVAHSNGAMIASVYVRRDDEHARRRVHRLITSGAPYLGAMQALAAHTQGYIFEADESPLGLTWDVAWGDMIAMIRNVPGAYGLLPSRGYYDAARYHTPARFSLVDLYNSPLVGYDAMFDWMTSEKLLTDPARGLEEFPYGLARNAQIWANQQAAVHGATDDWRTYSGPPQIYRHVGILNGSTATGWFLGPGPAVIFESSRLETGDTGRHGAYRERLRPVLGWGDRTVPLVSATLGRHSAVGNQDFSGVDESPWIEEFEYYACNHGGLVDDGCRPFDGAGPDALDRIVEILESGHRVLAPAGGARTPSNGLLTDHPSREVLHVHALAPIRVVIEDSEGRRTGPTDPDLPGAVEHGIPDVVYHGSSLGASFSVSADSAYTITVVTQSDDAVVHLTRQLATGEAITNFLYPDQILVTGASLAFVLEAGGTPESASWALDVDGDGTPDELVAPAAVLQGTDLGFVVPLPYPLAFEVGVPVQGEPVVETLTVPDTGVEGWTFRISGDAPWLSLSATEGDAPRIIEVTLDPEGLEKGDVETLLSLTVGIGGYETDVQIPVRLHVGVTVSGEEIAIPTDFGLHANYPNPFRESTTIAFELPHPAHARLAVYDVLGRRVVLLLDEAREAGRHEIAFEAVGLRAGVYLYRLVVSGDTTVRRMTLIR